MIKLEDLVPEGSEFTLKSTGLTYKLRAFTMQDEIWLAKTFGEGIKEIFEKAKMQEICKIVFHQLENKEDFCKREVKIINEDGEEVKGTIGGVDLLISLISGMDEKLNIINALLATIGISRGVMEKIQEDTEKKKSNEPSGRNLAVIFDVLSSEYGWTTEYILSRTIKEINWRMDAINDRRENQLKFEAKIHNFEIKNQPKDLKPIELKGMDKHKTMALNRIRKRHGK